MECSLASVGLLRSGESSCEAVVFVNVVTYLLFRFVVAAAMYGQHNWIVVQYELCVSYRGSLTDLCGSVFL